MTNTATNVAAVAAALKEAGDKAMPLPIAATTSRRNTMSKSGVGRSSVVGSLPSPPASLPAHKFVNGDGKIDVPDSAIDDDLNDMSADEDEDGNVVQKSRIRRASDGQPLVKEGRKSHRVELRCDKCGKGYKHSSCLTKHLFVPAFLPHPFRPYSVLVLCGKCHSVCLVPPRLPEPRVLTSQKPPGGNIPRSGHLPQSSSSRSISRFSFSRLLRFS